MATRKRLFNPRLVKCHRNYTVGELAHLYDVHDNTVRLWIKAGLPVYAEKKPHLIMGADVVIFHQARRAKNKHPCKPGEIYCMRCRAPKSPAGGLAEYQPKTRTGGVIAGICPACDGMMYRIVSVAKLGLSKGRLDLSLPPAHSRIGDTTQPLVNCDF